MAAPLKMGIDYFPLVVNFFEKDKIKLLRARHGGDRAAIVVLRLLCKIYEHGFYYRVGQNEILLLMLDMGGDFSAEYIQSVIASAAEFELFDKELYEKKAVLTSLEIQENYSEATARRKNKDYLSDPFWMATSRKTPPSVINENINPLNENINPLNETNNSQRRVDKSKVKESNENVFTPPTLIEVQDYFTQTKELAAADAEYWTARFINFYETKGWMVGKSKMKKWRSAAANALMTWGDSRKPQTQYYNEKPRPTSIRV